MDAIIVVYIVSVCLYALTILLFKNSYDYRQWVPTDDGGKYLYKEKDRLTAPLWVYILVGITLAIPIMNLIIGVALLIWCLMAIWMEDIYLNMPCLEFLTKEY